MEVIHADSFKIPKVVVEVVDEELVDDWWWGELERPTPKDTQIHKPTGDGEVKVRVGCDFDATDGGREENRKGDVRSEDNELRELGEVEQWACVWTERVGGWLIHVEARQLGEGRDISE